MYRLLEPEEVIAPGDELLPGGIHFKFIPVIVTGSLCGKMVIRRRIDEEKTADASNEDLATNIDILIALWCAQRGVEYVDYMDRVKLRQMFYRFLIEHRKGRENAD